MVRDALRRTLAVPLRTARDRAAEGGAPAVLSRQRGALAKGRALLDGEKLEVLLSQEDYHSLKALSQTCGVAMSEMARTAIKGMLKQNAAAVARSTEGGSA
jgi:hypothetical protein